MSIPSDALAVQVLAGLKESLSFLRQRQQEAVQDLYAGSQAQAGGRLKRLFLGWSEFLQAVREILPAVEPAHGTQIQKVFVQTASLLARINQALSRQDWVETADLLTLEGEGLLDAWREVLVPPGSPAGQ